MKSDKSKEFLKNVKLPLSSLDFMTIRNGMQTGKLKMKDLPDKLRTEYSIRFSKEFERITKDLEDRGLLNIPPYG